MAQTIDPQTAEQLAGPDRDASNAVGFHARLGIDDRAVYKGAQRNDAISNINAFPALLRARDDDYYSEMPMNTDATDPSNVQADTTKLEELRKVLNARVEEVKLQSTAAPGPVSIQAAAPLRPMTWKYEWNHGPRGWRRIQYFLSRGNRVVYLFMFVIVLMTVGYIVNSMMK